MCLEFFVSVAILLIIYKCIAFSYRSVIIMFDTKQFGNEQSGIEQRRGVFYEERFENRGRDQEA